MPFEIKNSVTIIEPAGFLWVLFLRLDAITGKWEAFLLVKKARKWLKKFKLDWAQFGFLGFNTFKQSDCAKLLVGDSHYTNISILGKK